MTFLWLLSGITGIVLVVNLIIFLVFIFNFKGYSLYQKPCPVVSVLVAARNEEDNIAQCVRSLVQLDYPDDRFELLIGDDRSTDHTWEVLQKLKREYDKVSIYQVTGRMGMARGKANVLASLARRATGDIYFITDADCVVHKNWLRSLLAAQSEGVGIVIGITSVSSAWQNMHWLLALGMVKAVTDLGRPLTAMGNNMCITKEAYDAIGGYESIPFSITEDYELFKHVTNKGFMLRQVVEKGALSISRPVESWKKLLHQRKRWMTGAVQLPISTLLFLIAQLAYYPAIILLFLTDWQIALPVFMAKSFVQSMFVLSMARKVSLKVRGIHLALFDLYLGLISVLSSLFYIMPVKTQWKGRKY